MMFSIKEKSTLANYPLHCLNNRYCLDATALYVDFLSFIKHQTIALTLTFRHAPLMLPSLVIRHHFTEETYNCPCVQSCHN